MKIFAILYIIYIIAIILLIINIYNILYNIKLTNKKINSIINIPTPAIIKTNWWGYGWRPWWNNFN